MRHVPAGGRPARTRTQYGWSRMPRSEDGPSTANGQLVGSMAQPEHVRQAWTLALSAMF